MTNNLFYWINKDIYKTFPCVRPDLERGVDFVIERKGAAVENSNSVQCNRPTNQTGERNGRKKREPKTQHTYTHTHTHKCFIACRLKSDSERNFIVNEFLLPVNITK